MNVVESRLLIETAKIVQSLAQAFNTGVGGNAIDTTKLSAAIQYYEDFEARKIKNEVAK